MPDEDLQPRRSTAAWTVLASILGLAALAYPLWRGEVFSLTDLWKLTLPIRSFYASCLASGESPLWFPDILAGYYLHGTGHAGMCHPLSFVLYRFLPLYAVLDLEILTAYPVMFAGMYAFLRRWDLRRDCALFGAMLFTFSTYNIMRLIHPNALQILGHIPWVLFCTDVVMRSPSGRRAAWAAVAIGLLNTSELLLGYPQYFWFSSLSLASYVLLLTCLGAFKWRRVAILSIGFALGIAGGGAQLLPSRDALSISVRTLSSAWTVREVLINSTTPRYVLQMVCPYLLDVSHKQRLYIGAIPLLLTVWAAVRRKSLGVGRPLVIGSLLLAGLMLWLALGQFGYLYRLHPYIPVIGTFRFPSRYVHVMNLGTSICGAFALADLLSLASQRRERLKRPMIALAVVFMLSVGVTTWALCATCKRRRRCRCT